MFGAEGLASGDAGSNLATLRTIQKCSIHVTVNTLYSLTCTGVKEDTLSLNSML